jgi:hypothetical protein
MTLAFVLVAALGMFVLSGYLFSQGWNAGWLARAVLARRTESIATLRHRQIEARGELAADEPLRAEGGEACVWVARHVTSRWTTTGSKGGTIPHVVTRSDVRRAPKVWLRDPSGAVELDLHEALCLGEKRTFATLSDEGLRATYPSFASLMHNHGHEFEVAETRLEVGATVRVWAERLEGHEGAKSGYRASPMDTRTLRGDNDRGVVVAIGSQPALVWHSLLPALGGAAFGLLIAAYGGWLLYMLWVGWLA